MLVKIIIEAEDVDSVSGVLYINDERICATVGTTINEVVMELVQLLIVHMALQGVGY